jgi:hypothetical protein
MKCVECRKSIFSFKILIFPPSLPPLQLCLFERPQYFPPRLTVTPLEGSVRFSQHGLGPRHDTSVPNGAAIKSALCDIAEAQIPSKCWVWHVLCRQRPVRISLLLFWVLQRLPKRFNGTLYMTSPQSLFVFFFFCMFSFGRKLHPHVHWGFYALQTR